MYRLHIVSRGSVVEEVFSDSLGYLHQQAEDLGYYGQLVSIHEVIQSLDGYVDLGLVDAYHLTGRNTDAILGCRKPLRASPWITPTPM